uniref:Laminin G domain-containing protein n=1 Tax=Phasianus colchicus TaxID=9054 RepID=A0A669R4R7_PHACC
MGSHHGVPSPHRLRLPSGREPYVATFRGAEFFCYDLSHSPIQSSADELTLSFRTRQRHGLLLHTGRSADYVNLSLKAGAVWLVINLGSGAFEALVEPVNGKFNDDGWHDVRVTRNLRQVGGRGWGGAERGWRFGGELGGVGWVRGWQMGDVGGLWVATGGH